MYFINLRKDDNSYLNIASKTQTRLLGPFSLKESFEAIDFVRREIIEDIKITNDLEDEKEIIVENYEPYDDDENIMVSIGMGDDYWYIIRLEAEKDLKLTIKDFLR